ncbi:MAG: type IX secretion system membrane protein PorP/SprF [bacterium]
MALTRKIMLSGFLLLYALHFGNGLAQNLIVSEGADIYDPQASFLNPALISFQEPQATFGARIFQAGFLQDNALGLRSSYASFSYPGISHTNLGVGVTASRIGTPIFSENNLALQASYKIGDRAAIGAQLGLLSLSFDRDKFILEDESDPLIERGTSVNNFTLGAGFFWLPTERLRLSAGFLHLNRPSLSIENAFRQPVRIDVGAKYRFSKMDIGANLEIEGERVAPMVTFATFSQGLGSLKLLYSSEAWHLQTQVYGSERMSLDYRASFPLSEINAEASGSHRLSLIYRFGDRQKSRFEVSSALKTLLISETTTSFHAAGGLPELQPSDLYFLHHGQAFSNQASVDLPIGRFEDKTRRSTSSRQYAQYYRSLLQIVSSQLRENPGASFRILVAEGKERAAIALLQSMQNELNVQPGRISMARIPDSSTTAGLSRSLPKPGIKVELSAPANVFELKIRWKRSYMRAPRVKSWRLLIQNRAGDTIKIFRGSGEVPGQVRWDWKDEIGHLVAPGMYSYFLQWTDQADVKQTSPVHFLKVNKRLRNIRIELENAITRMPANGKQEIQLILYK